MNITITALALLFSASSFALDRGDVKLVDGKIFLEGRYVQAVYAPLIRVDDSGATTLLKSGNGKLVIGNLDGTKLDEVNVQNCGWSREDVNKLIKNRELLVLCPRSESFSIVDLDTKSVNNFSNQIDFWNKNIVFDQKETGFISFKYAEGGFTTHIRWFDLVTKKFGPVIRLNQQLDLRQYTAKNQINVHLFKSNGRAMVTLVGRPNTYSNSEKNEVNILTIDLLTGTVIAAKSALEEHHVSASNCNTVVSGSDVVEIDNVSYLVAKNYQFYARGCSALDLNWDGSDNTQFALIDPMNLVVMKKFSVSEKLLPKSDYGFKDVVTINGQPYLANKKGFSENNKFMALNLLTGAPTSIPAFWYIPVNSSNLFLNIDSTKCWPVSDSITTDAYVTEVSTGEISKTTINKISSGCEYYSNDFGSLSGGIMDTNGQIFHVRVVESRSKVEVTRIY